MTPEQAGMGAMGPRLHRGPQAMSPPSPPSQVAGCGGVPAARGAGAAIKELAHGVVRGGIMGMARCLAC